MSAGAALDAIIAAIKADATCAAAFGARVYDREPFDTSRDGIDGEAVNPLLKCWLGPMNARRGGCDGWRAELRIYVEGYAPTRGPVWNAALAVVACLEALSSASLSTPALLRPVVDVLDAPEDLISTAIDIGFTFE